MGTDSTAGGGPDSNTGDGSGSDAGGSTASSFAGTLASLFFGSVFRILGTGVLAIVLVAVVAVAAGFVGVPAVQGLENEFAAVNDSTTIIASDLKVQNPNPIGAGFLGASAQYEITMNDVPMANGTSGEVSMPPGNSTIPLQTHLDNDRIPAWWVSHVQRGERTDVKINATVASDFLGRSVPVRQTQTVETDMLSSFNSTETRPINSSSPLVSDPLLYVNETRAKWGEATPERTGIVIDFYIYNPKEYAIPVSKLNYTIAMNDVRVGAGENTDEKVLAPREVTRVQTVTYIQNDNLDEWWVTHLQRNEVTDVVIDFAASVDVAGTEIAIPLDDATHRETIETDVFGSKDDTPPGNATGYSGADQSDDASTGENGTSTSENGTSTSDDGSTDGSDGTTSEDGATSDGETTAGDETTSDGEGTTTDDGGILSTVGVDAHRVTTDRVASATTTVETEHVHAPRPATGF